MKILCFFIGIILISFSMGYLFYPQIILKINEWTRDWLLSDKNILLYRRKIGAYLLIFAILFIFIALSIK